MTSTSTKLAPALIKARKEFAPAVKNSTNPHLKNRYADLSACLDAVNDALLNNGIALLQETSEAEHGVVVETVFMHESGETLRCGRLFVPASKHDPQGFGSALTYARRYSLLTACAIAPEDDDGNAAARGLRARGKATRHEKQELTPADTKKWNFAIAAYKRDGNLDAVLERMTISEANQAALIAAAQEHQDAVA